MALDHFLSSLGLSTTEQRIYLLTIEDGPALATELAKRLELPRNTVRGVLDSLVSRGLMSRAREKNRFIYSPETPENLRRHLVRRREAILAECDGQLELLRSAARNLVPKKQFGRKPRVRFFSGLNNLKQLYEDTLTSHEEIRSWASFDANQKILPAYFESYYRRRAAKGISIVGILPDTALARAHSPHDRAERRRAYLVPTKLFNITPEIQVYDNKVNIVSWNDRIGVLIESEPIAEGVRAVFDLCRKLLDERGRPGKRGSPETKSGKKMKPAKK